ncbi:hypothetical protein K4K55_006375 [Colletotrichum sp. SAR 10_96]|nr:hypothetical protein K4K55_006375 [Colletotrichum sp. SAR 10_96]
MAYVQLNHGIPHRNRLHPGDYIVHNCRNRLFAYRYDRSFNGAQATLPKYERNICCYHGQCNFNNFRNRGHRRSHSDRNLFYCQFYETITFLTTLPVDELLSSSEHNYYYLWNRHHGDIDIDGRYFQHQLYHLLVATSVPGHEFYFISVYLGQHNGATVPNSEWNIGGGAYRNRTSRRIWNCLFHNRGPRDIERSQRHGNDASIPCWQCHRDPGIDWQRNCHPVPELNILLAAIFAAVVFTSVPSYWVFNYPCHCHQLNRADGVFNAMPYGHLSSMPTCTSKWQNTTSTKPSTGATNRTSSNTATTLLTSTTKASVSAEGDSTTMFEPDVPVMPTTTVSDFTLPSNKAYPWGGNGPLFRRPNTTATDSENIAVRQPGFTFSFGRTQSSTEAVAEDDGSIDEKSAETDIVDENSAAAMTTANQAKTVEDDEREWVIVPSNPEDEPEERAEPRGIFVSYGIGSPCGCSVKGEFRFGWGKGGAPTGEGL